MSTVLLIFFITIIIILCLILFYYISETSVVNQEYNSTIQETECKDMRWGCCEDELTPKLDDQGSNCRGF